MTRYRRHRRLSLWSDLLLTGCFLVVLTLIAMRMSEPVDTQVFVGPFRVIDGDTLATGAQRLRLSGIDAPELAQTCRDVRGMEWPCGQAARTMLERLMGDAPECRGSDKDRYGRIVVSCRSAGRAVNADMVEAGYALSTDAIAFRREQSAAEAARRGIWQGEFQHPRVWREHAGVAQTDGSVDGLWTTIRSFLARWWL